MKLMSTMVVSSCLGLMLVTPALAGPIWEECEMDDAGKLPGTAQVPNQLPQGTPLEEICGKFDPLEPQDTEDMFLIEICDPAAFSASAVVTSGSMNLQLWLFDINGFGLIANDDSIGTNPAFGNMPLDGGGPALTTPGFYYIAVSLFDSDPVDSAGQPLFQSSTPTEVSGPDGPGGGNPIADWAGTVTAGQGGQYALRMTGTCYAPAPGVGSLMAIAGSVLLRRRRR